ncbi:Chlorogenate--glucarate O-hydroxycinnamoyltransferase [Handroanthus impetiginosus]|uniref:Chlorogenate--glucarate O-hydroxycinnamoyltransferase n=1 Tax=Handroanthus impetiginosus TaxID=429701 RepID=A0A2G9G3J3_9LAMI|nr:Chlorogenate--glucarate O-hydroxycinnamoyltransferase [Handroanthus impetiginosus]
MAASASPCVKKSVLAVQIVLFFLFLSFAIDAHPLKICKFDIYQLEDSISDTGNLIREVPIGASTAFARLPYGETFFKNPTGRCSDGLLMIDYITVDPHLTLFETQKACCGIGGKYNFNMRRMCGAPGVPVCKDPHRYVSWDGVHLTQNGYKIMAGWLVQDIFGKLLCLF